MTDTKQDESNIISLPKHIDSKLEGKWIESEFILRISPKLLKIVGKHSKLWKDDKYTTVLAIEALINEARIDQIMLDELSISNAEGLEDVDEQYIISWRANQLYNLGEK